MRQKLILAALLILAIKSFSQNSKVSLELNYPITIDENFIGKNSNGVVDAGIKFRFVKLDVVNIGLSFNVGIYRNSKEDRVQPFDVTTYIFSPRIYTEFNIKSMTKFHPSVGLGYSIVNAKADENLNRFNSQNDLFVESTQSVSGINLNLGLLYDLTHKLFVQVQYDFIKVGVDNGVPDITYNTNINLFKIGIGYRF